MSSAYRLGPPEPDDWRHVYPFPHNDHSSLEGRVFLTVREDQDRLYFQALHALQCNPLDLYRLGVQVAHRYPVFLLVLEDRSLQEGQKAQSELPLECDLDRRRVPACLAHLLDLASRLDQQHLFVPLLLDYRSCPVPRVFLALP